MDVKKGDYIRMNASLSGSDFSWSPGQVLKVGKDIDADTATSLVSLPEDDPRASVISDEEAKRLFHEEPVYVPPANEIPPGENHQRHAPAEAVEERGAAIIGVDEWEALAPDEQDRYVLVPRDEIVFRLKEEEHMEKRAEETATSPAAEERETTSIRREKRVKPKPPPEKPTAKT
jgi:hypothetical protein